MIRTTSLETSKALKENGFPQETFWAHKVLPDGSDFCLSGHSLAIDKLNVEAAQINPQDEYTRIYGLETKFFHAPTSDELLEELPESVTEHGVRYSMEIVRHKLFDEKKFFISYEDNDGCMLRHECSDNESLPEALAAMWLFLKKEGLIK